MTTLSKVMSSRGEGEFRILELEEVIIRQVEGNDFKIQAEGLLKNKIFELVKGNEEGRKAGEILSKDSRYQGTLLEETIEKISYLSRGILGNHHKASNYISKTGHHLRNSIVNNVRNGTTFFTAGAGLVAGGLVAAPALPAAATAAFVVGGIMVAFSVFNPFRLATGDDPINR
jgi:hypothetical protein